MFDAIKEAVTRVLKPKEQPTYEEERFFGKRIKDLAPETLTAIHKHFKQQVEDILSQRQEEEAILQERLRLYHLQPRPHQGPWANSAHTCIGLAAEVVDTVAEGVWGILTSILPIPNVQTIRGNSDNEDEIEAYLHSWCTHEINAQDFLDETIYGASLEGIRNVIQWVEPVERVRLVKRNGKVVEQVEKKYRPVIENIPWENAIVHAYASKKRELLEQFSWRKYMTRDALMDYAIQRGLTNIEALMKKKMDKPGHTNPIEVAEKEAQKDGGAVINETMRLRLALEGKTAPDEPMHEIILTMGHWRFKENEVREKILYIYNRTTDEPMEIRWLPKFYQKFPVYGYILHRRDASRGGHSMIEFTEEFNHEMNILNDRMLDNIEISVNKVVTYVDGSEFDPAKYKIFPGAMLPQSQKDDLGTLPLGDISFQPLGMMRALEQWARMRAGISGSTTGSIDAADPRMSGKKAGMLLGQTDKKLTMYAKRINDTFVEMMSDWLSYMAVLGEDQTEYEKWDGETDSWMPATIPIEAFERDYFITMNGFTFSKNRNEDMQNELFIQDLQKQSPIFTMGPEELAKFAPSQVKAIYENDKAVLMRSGQVNADKRLPDLAEIMPPKRIPPPDSPPPVPPMELAMLGMGPGEMPVEPGAGGAPGVTGPVPPPDGQPPAPPAIPPAPAP